MANQLFSGSLWADQELIDLLKELEKMYAAGVRQSTFKDQTLIFGSTKELQQRISDLRKELCDRGLITDSDGTPIKPKGKKQVRVTTRNKGFR